MFVPPVTIWPLLYIRPVDLLIPEHHHTHTVLISTNDEPCIDTFFISICGHKFKSFSFQLQEVGKQAKRSTRGNIGTY